jgi:hypothetical protein
MTLNGLAQETIFGQLPKVQLKRQQSRTQLLDAPSNNKNSQR